MAEGEVTKSVMMTLKAKDEGASAAFKQLGNTAESADKKVQGVGSQLNTAGKEMKKFERGVGALQGTVFGLTNSLGLMDERLGKMAGAVGIVHTLTQGVRGLGLTLGTGVGGALGVGVLGALGAVGVAAGAGYLLWNKYQEGVKESTERLKSLTLALKEVQAITSLGLSTSNVATQAQARYGISQQWSGPRQGLADQYGGLLAQQGAARAFSDNPFAAGLAGNRAEQIGLAGQAGREAMTGPGAIMGGPGALQDAMARMRGQALGSLTGAPGLQRNLAVAEAAAAAARSRQGATAMGLAGAQRGVQAVAANLNYQQLIARQRALRQSLEQPGASTAAGSDWGFEGPTTLDAAQSAQRRRSQQAELAQVNRQVNEARHREREFGGVAPANEQDVANRQKELLEASQQRIAAEQKLLEVKKAINAANVADLQTIRQSVAEQAKSFTELRKSQEARQFTARASVGNMGALDKMQLSSIAQKVKAGQDLNSDELAFAGKFDFAQEAIQKQGLKNFGNDKAGQDILGAFGVDRRVEEARGAEKQTLELKGQVEAKVQAQIKIGTELESQLIEQLIKPIAEAIRQTLAGERGALDLQIRQKAREEIEAAFNDLRGGTAQQKK